MIRSHHEATPASVEYARSIRTPTLSKHEADTRNRFDAWSESSAFRRIRPWLTYVQGQVLDQVDWGGVSHVLDVACGDGWAVHQAAQRLGAGKGKLACGCDISGGMLRQRGAVNLRPAEAHLLVASAQALPYRSDSFDVIMCTAAFHHFPLPLQALGEFRRVLRPGGLALIADTCRDQSLGTWVWDRLHRWFEKGHVKYYRTDELRNLLADAGFEPVRMVSLRPTYAETKKLVCRTTLFCAAAPSA